MQAIDIRHQLHIHRYQIIVFLVVALSWPAKGQNNPSEHLTEYDDQFIHYGFLISLHNSRYRTLYDDAYATDGFDTLHSVVPSNTGGFKLGFVVNFHLLQYLDFRILPTVGFYENSLLYRLTDETVVRELKDATMVEFPMLLKYKSQRRGNYAAYLVGGINPSFEAVARDDEEISRDALALKRWNLSLEFGAGMDIYFPLFKFSPEIRYSLGLTNMLDADSNSPFNAPLKQLNMHNIGLFITFEGGPSTGKTRKLDGPLSRSSKPRSPRKQK